MDSGSGEAGSLAVTGSLQRLSTEMGVAFQRIFEARRRTEEGLEDRRRKLATLRADNDVAVVLMGSWGRGELTSRSDDDFMLLIDGDEQRDALEALATEDQESSEAFATAKRLGKEIRSGLLSLLFDTPVLYPLTREFAIF